ncbi:hypothetical protein NP493_402g02028 [Ridgeia piscesae]|uniref:Uncharacterized protein n=1 Tax=Ridgeia piscesae TaxID=27915 RepID=A0AAD9L1K4_RIDPI|nr:hypothetical protein NP493_402g02028 [Ridgeia piscesae]
MATGEMFSSRSSSVVMVSVTRSATCNTTPAARAPETTRVCRLLCTAGRTLPSCNENDVTRMSFYVFGIPLVGGTRRLLGAECRGRYLEANLRAAVPHVHAYKHTTRCIVIIVNIYFCISSPPCHM